MELFGSALFLTLLAVIAYGLIRLGYLLNRAVKATERVATTANSLATYTLHLHRSVDGLAKSTDELAEVQRPRELITGQVEEFDVPGVGCCRDQRDQGAQVIQLGPMPSQEEMDAARARQLRAAQDAGITDMGDLPR